MMKKMKNIALIFLNGYAPKKATIKKVSKIDAYFICADGAYKYLEGIIIPDALIGDYDSLGKLPSVEMAKKIYTYPKDKDSTAGELAIDYAISLGVSEIKIYGATGGRIDHYYANISLLYKAKQANVKAQIITQDESIEIVTGKVNRKVKRGSIVSIVPFFDEVHILTTKGLKFSATSLTVKREQSIGVSNEAESEEIEIVLSDKPGILYIKEMAKL